MLPSDGTYFFCVDLAASGIGLDDYAFCSQLVRQAGVAAIPLSVFYLEAPIRSMIRLCFAKQDDVLDAAIERLAAFRNQLVVGKR